jgi:pyruvate dehydrogenase (quinone)/pyruvate oxidase
MLEKKKDRGFLQTAQEGMKDWLVLMNERATRSDKPLKPQVVAHELGRRLPDNAIVSCDSGTIATWWARHIPVKRGQMHSISGTLATKGPVIVEAVVDPFEPPMPPKATLKQGFELAKALVRGTPDRGKIMATILEDKVKEMI